MDIVFIVGTGRCGSSLIQEMISRHKHVGFISNIDDRLSLLNLKGRFNNALFRTPVGRFTRKSRLRFAPSEAYNLISRRVSPMYAYSCRDLEARDVTSWIEQRCKKLFLQRYEIQRKPIFLHKYTGWSRIGFFLRIFPKARFIHIVRDGRAVANSWLQMPWWGGYSGPENWLWGELQEPYRTEWLESGRSYVTLAGIAWKTLMDSYERASRELEEGRYMWFRYEDFLNDPKVAIEKVFAFTGLEWTQAFDRHFSQIKIQSSRRNAFETELGQERCAELEECLSEKLVKYGYLS